MPEPLNILVVEDDLQLRDALCLTLECAGHQVLGAADGPAALRLLEREAFNLVVSDLRMQPMDGIELLKAIRSREPHLPVLLMTAFGDVDKAVSAMRAGACDFCSSRSSRMRCSNMLPATPHGRSGPRAWWRTMRAHATCWRSQRGVAKTEATVLLTGESGTGKEVFARHIHAQSPRAAAPFIAINCAAIPENLLEATLFGHEKGSFTGAQAAQAGKFEQAQGGTLLLDEISEMPLALQAKLLRVLQEREVDRVGGKKPIALDIRVLATSNRDMAKEVVAGRFREDLYYRLNVFPLRIPALRERPADIVPLARHFAALHGSPAARFASDAESLLAVHAWPGNVRELENAVQRALILAGGDAIAAEHLQLSLQVQAPAGTPQLTAAQMEVRPVAPVQAAPSNMRDLERQHILETLATVNGSRKRAVELLGISERTLRYKLQQYRTAGVM
ncbi:MAG: sigma-54 dependent transcriptional regulator [Rhodocyclaceae bacterium]|nr:sigma-54 dependent transcriptional regulator [Rhodocyclaceae bacterium]